MLPLMTKTRMIHLFTIWKLCKSFTKTFHLNEVVQIFQRFFFSTASSRWLGHSNPLRPAPSSRSPKSWRKCHVWWDCYDSFRCSGNRWWNCHAFERFGYWINNIPATWRVYSYGMAWSKDSKFVLLLISTTLQGFYFDEKMEQLKIELNEALPIGQNYSMEIKFSGLLTGKIVGFYRSSYKTEDGETRWVEEIRSNFMFNNNNAQFWLFCRSCL